MALHCYAFQRQRLWLHPYSAEVGVMTLLVNSLVADIGDSSDDIWLINGNHKNTALIGNTTTKQSRIGRVKQCYIGIGYGLTLLIDDGARQMEICLVGTFHINLMFSTLDHTYRIKASQLHYGIGNRFVLQMGCYAEVFKFIVDKGDIVISGLFLNVSQGVGKGDILKGVRDLLCTCN